MVKPILAGLVAAAALALVAVPVALADDPNGTQYGNPSGGVSTEPPPTIASEPPAVTTEPPAVTTEPPAFTTPTIVPKTRTNVKGQAASATAKATPSVAPKVGSLPFTGLDLGLVLGFGLVLVGGGVLLRRTGRAIER